MNFVTCHDGFTLADLVSYNHKHNEANGEDNQDGTDDNRSWNCGAEGPSDDPAVGELRARQVRNFLVTLFCSQGVPMLLAGDEMGRTQRGSNNAYCQDSPLSWVDWENAAKYADLADFTAALSALRRAHPVFRRRRFFSGRPAQAGPGGLRDIIWLTPSGREMTDADWHGGYARSLAVFLNGDAITEPAPAASPSATSISCCCSTRTAKPCGSSCPAPITPTAGMRSSTRRRRRAGPAPVQAAGRRWCPAGRRST